jgi:hypothetical protein
MFVDNSRKIGNIREEEVEAMATQALVQQILSRIYGHKRGWVFSPLHFLDLGNDVGIRKSLQGLCDQGTIRRLTRGLYDYPERHPQLGDLTPSAEQIAQALAGKEGLRIQPSGAYAVNVLGLSTQVPAKAVFLTDGAERTITVGNRTIQLKRTTPKNMAAAGRTSGLVIQALRYLGRDRVDDSVVERLAQRLSKDDRQELMKDIQYAPAWIGDVFRRLAKLDG